MFVIRITMIVLSILMIAPLAVANDSQPADSDVETVYVVQPKYRTLSNRVELSLQGIQKVNSIFIRESGGLLSLIYHIRENLAAELSGGWMFFRDNSVSGSQIKLNTAYTAELVHYYRTPWLATANFQWSILTGKALFHQVSLGQFNIYLTVGAGATGLELKNVSLQDEPLALVSSVQFTSDVGGGIRFYFTDHFGIRFEVRDYIQPLLVRKTDFSLGEVDQSSFNVSHLVLAQLGLSVIF